MTDRIPKRERQHYVPRWVLDGFTDSGGNLYAYRIGEGRGFTTGPADLFVEVNINTALSDDGKDVLVYSERSHSWFDRYGSRVARSIRDAARSSAWHPRPAVITGSPETLSWFTGLPLVQTMRSPWVRRKAEETAEQRELTGEARRMMVALAGSSRLPGTEAYLNAGRPTVLRTRPPNPLIVGDDIVVRAGPLADGRASFIGALVDQHTVIGRDFVRTRRALRPNEIDVIELTAVEVERVNGQVAANAETIAGSQKALVWRFGSAERRRRLGPSA